tara:strand:- start:1706 stop:2230 length:525 start_codon:yes stop_codon:yes gene_type:complete
MNRRDFIKGAAALPAVGLIPLEPVLEHESLTETASDPALEWPYRVYCYERKQGEWTFSKNTRGSFASEREYMTFDEENDLSWNPHYATGWMDGGVLHFQTLDEATDFVDIHARTKGDVNILDTIYDVYFKRAYDEGEGGVEMQVAHYWFNGDTGGQIHWVSPKPYIDWSKVEYA